MSVISINRNDNKFRSHVEERLDETASEYQAFISLKKNEDEETYDIMYTTNFNPGFHDLMALHYLLDYMRDDYFDIEEM